jgi:hypothetical protein
MKEKHIRIFAAVFVLLLIVYVVTRPRQRSVDVEEIAKTIVIGVAEDDVHSIEVYKSVGPEEKIQMLFTRQGEGWRIPTHFWGKAQSSRMSRLVTDIIGMTGKVRSSDIKHFDKYRIGEDQGIHLLLRDEAEKTLANLIIGKRSDDINTGFVRFADKEKVYAVDKNLLSSLGIYGDADTLSQFNQKSFVNLQAVDEKKEDLIMAALVRQGDQMVIEKREKTVEPAAEDSTQEATVQTEWVLVNRSGREIVLDTQQVNQFLLDITRIRAQELVDIVQSSFADMEKNSRYGFNNPAYIIAYQKPDEDRKMILLGKEFEKDKGYYMKVQEDGLVYKLNKSAFDKIFKWMDDLPKKVAG